MRIKNTGTEEGESVRVRAMLKSEQPFDFSNGEAFDYVGDLDVDEIGEAVLKFDVGDDAALKTYLLDIEIRCVEDEDVHLFDKKVPVVVANAKQSTLMTCICSTGKFLSRWLILNRAILFRFSLAARF
jgi:hypothetical protein